MSATVHPIGKATEAEVTFWPSLTNPLGVLRRMTWDALFADLSKVQPFRGDDHPGWSAAVFRDDRRAKAGVLRVTAACLDYDNGTPPETVLERWRGMFGLLHTTRSHTEAKPRFRIVLPLSRPVSWFEWEGLWSRLNAHAQGNLDGQAKDASRFWFMPGIRDDGEFFAKRLEGVPLDVDEWLARPAPVEHRSAPTPTRERRDETSVVERARQYLARMDPSISGSGGNAALWKASLALGRGFALSESETLELLRYDFNSRCSPPWDDKTLVRHAARAVKHATVEDGYIIKNSNWQERPRKQERQDQPEPVEESIIDEPPEWFDMNGPEFDVPVDLSEVQKRELKVVSLHEMLSIVAEKARSGVPAVGISACHPDIDNYTAGFRRGKITVLGARTSFGKSSYCIAVADEALRKGENVLVISVEDDEETFGQRFMARRAQINAARLRVNRSERKELDKMDEAVAMAQRSKMFMSAIGWTIEDICDAIRETAKETPPALIVFDYLQRASTRKSFDRRNEVTHIANMLCNTIKEVNAAGILVSQLKRPDSGNPNKPPTMFDLKESGDVENMAEHILLGHVENKGQVERFLYLKKNKDGPLPDDDQRFLMPFDHVTASFRVGVSQPKWNTTPDVDRYNPDDDDRPYFAGDLS
jgi:KaiC/GvpD/RAD55 family RecA-like ATPase